MKKRRSRPLPPLPPLSLQVLSEVRDVEEIIQDALQDCGDNLERVRQTLHAGVAAKFNVQMNYYFSLPGHQIAWFAQVIPKTVDSIIGMCSALAPGDQFRGELLRTAAHHMAQRLEADKKQAATAAPSKPSPSPSEDTIAAQLQRLRDECRWTIPDLAEATDISVRQVARHLSGEFKPLPRKISAYERAFSNRLKRQIVIRKMP